jgi:TRAP-type C4-dicarboxylate transport system substrate-binding protein
MFGKIRRGLPAFAGLLAAVSLTAGDVAAQVKMRVSLDTSAIHIRTKLVGEYLEAVKKKSGGAIEPELYHSGQLFRDRDVGKALRQGGVEMAVPGQWVLTGFEPNLDFPFLPSCYGRSREEFHKISDGEVGKQLNASLEQKLNAKVLGKWMDLGASHSYSASKPLHKPEDLKGMKIRTSGGHGQFIRVKFLEGVPNFTAWPDVPLALSQGNFDGLITTNESLVSAKLWEAGVKYALQDFQGFAQYIPLVADAFLEKLTPEQRKILFDTWAEMIDGFRQQAAAAQDKARETMAEHGIKVVDAAKADLDATRKRMLATQDDVVKELKMDPAVVAKIDATLGAMN